MEDEHGTYIMNSKDLRAVEQIAKLTAIGVDSLKVEGRTIQRAFWNVIRHRNIRIIYLVILCQNKVNMLVR